MGDQPEAIDTLVEGIENGIDEQILLGVTVAPVQQQLPLDGAVEHPEGDSPALTKGDSSEADS